MHQQVADPAASGEKPQQTRVYGMSAAWGESNFVGSSAKALSDYLACVVEHQPCVAGAAVQAPRVGLANIECGEQRFSC